MHIALAGTGYVGLSLAVLLSQYNEVTAVDIDGEKVRLINDWKSPIHDEYNFYHILLICHCSASLLFRSLAAFSLACNDIIAFLKDRMVASQATNPEH